MTFKSATPQQHAAFISALAAGQYNLLLGAGSSMDSHNVHGLMPSGEALKDELCKVTDADKKHSLQRVFSLLKPNQISTHVTKRFSGCVPGETPKLMSRFLWRRIFTWNIDDVIENAYQDSDAKQNLVSIHYNDDYIEAPTLADLQLVHLHGAVTVPDKGYVFSREHYIAQVQTINPWMAVLTTFMRSEPMVIAGTTLDEIDLDYYLSFRTSTTAREDRGPSILVTKDDDAVVRNICEQHSLLHFVGYTADFLKYCTTVLPHPPTPEELIPAAAKKLLPDSTSKSVAIAFHSDFELVPSSAQPSQSSRFQYGHIPSWQDLASDLDIPPAIVSDLVVQIQSLLKDGKSPAKLLYLGDKAGTGKTTVLRRTAFDLSKLGITTLLCSALSRIDRTAAEALDSIEGPLVIVIDNFAEQVTAISELLSKLQRSDVVVLAAERSYRSKYLDAVLSGITYSGISAISFSTSQLEGLINKYFENGNLGNPDILKNKRINSGKLRNEPIAVACCRILNDFKPLERIIDDIVNDADAGELDRYVCAALSQHCFNGGVKHSILSGSVGGAGIRAQLDRANPLPLAYFDTQKNYLIPENSTIAERVLANISECQVGRLLDIFISLASELQPFVNRQTIKARTPEARLAGRLFDFDDVVQKLLGGEADKFYNATMKRWQWNSRYWEQVALLNLSKYKRHPQSSDALTFLNTAVQRARQAVAIESHPFGLTTLGKILMVQMLVQSHSMSDIYQEAFEHLNTAIDREALRARRSIHPFISLFRGTADYLQNGGTLNSKQLKVVRERIQLATSRFARDVEATGLIATLKNLIT